MNMLKVIFISLLSFFVHGENSSVHRANIPSKKEKSFVKDQQADHKKEIAANRQTHSLSNPKIEY